jgi:hypothetical protein
MTLSSGWKQIGKLTRYINTLNSEGTEERYVNEQGQIGDVFSL